MNRKLGGLSGIRPAKEVANRWHDECGLNSWVKNMLFFGALKGTVQWINGYPKKNKLSTPLCFLLYAPDGYYVPLGQGRLKDIRKAVKIMEVNHERDAANIFGGDDSAAS